MVSITMFNVDTGLPISRLEAETVKQVMSLYDNLMRHVSMMSMLEKLHSVMDTGEGEHVIDND